MTNDGKELIEFDCEVLNETEKAYKIELLLAKKKKKQTWVPKSISEMNQGKKTSQIGIQRWFCEKEGLL